MDIYAIILNCGFAKIESACLVASDYLAIFPSGHIFNTCIALSRKANAAFKKPCPDFMSFVISEKGYFFFNYFTNSSTGQGFNLGKINGTQRYGIPYFWAEAKPYKDAQYYKGEDQLIWDSIVFATTLSRILPALPTLYVPLIAGDSFRIFSVQKTEARFEIVDMYSGSFRSVEGQKIWNRMINYSYSIANLIISSQTRMRANSEPRDNSFKDSEIVDKVADSANFAMVTYISYT
jgi:hypothetical protein